MPYLLPVDPAVSELACVLVYYPDAPEYRQALFGQLAELSDVWNWEGTREQQALARVAWLAAELETINNMTCLDELLAEVQAINAKLPWCCDDGTAWSEGVDGGDGTVTIWPTPGPPPLPVPDADFGTDDYPITPVTDPDDDGIVTATDWEQYLCGAANYLVDSLIDYLRFVRFQRSFTSSFLGVIRWLQARIAGAIIPGAADDFALWELNDLLDTVINAFENVPIAVIDDAIEDLEGLRQNIYCAIQGENLAQNAIDAALTIIFGSIDNALAQSLIGNPVALFASLIWNGALDVAWRDDCEECINPPVSSGLRLVRSITAPNGSTGTDVAFTEDANPGTYLEPGDNYNSGIAFDYYRKYRIAAGSGRLGMHARDNTDSNIPVTVVVHDTVNVTTATNQYWDTTQNGSLVRTSYLYNCEGTYTPVTNSGTNGLGVLSQPNTYLVIELRPA